MSINIKILDERLKFPEYFPKFSDGNAAVDLRACISKTSIIYPNEVVKISCGFAMHLLDESLVGLLVPRSGLGTNGLVMANSTGVIDSSYVGVITAAVWNRSYKEIVVNPMDRICQMLIQRVEKPLFQIVEEFPETIRGENGFGSSGMV